MLVDEAVEALQSQIDDTAIIACSGGVDSTVAAVLAHRAVGSLLHCVYVDTGLMRKHESGEVAGIFADLGIELEVVDASERFLSNLAGITEPEAKRMVIGEQFIRVFEAEQAQCGAKFLIQGTIAPDWIESGGGERDVIKSHHNVGGLPDDVNLVIVEPLREFYKDEVRAIARELGIASSERQPFPGPGLAVRILGEITPDRVTACREACHIVETQLQAAAAEGKCELPWQYFAALLPVKSVGVHGDARVHGETVVVRAVTSLDGMSASYSPIPHDILAAISTEITNSLKGQVNRVVYDITHKPPGTIEWE
ncbi:MAG: glutamine-hydrolyzing GMP synthase subunit GuaA [Candidatus Thalassarchaeum betae]|uniref:GMP synthase [glutamine-hydrolyzing] subunit B n=1 Tax=Candidatus Thalassarchaeum betae TaxID=2599289 RepID=A0A2V3HR82_9ARCH|nr:MAG: glutamine-hydrolyzing GMP synthase subunit GuaA [Candidatus Thalassoarchaea betae]PXF26710.1 MAG: glutamine-hydrolyzing GMP synthase subunit GuaA [Euryarchaeota archaeon]HIC50386.1 glutamine-hydrolyzing GMP synthase subunit GuaA [Candidatus Poseidoniales archaeon]HIM13719.1 glutamine-hydrolyzing GMP synthase subunit GuaA [Candidatus Poseidoniales archaeon]HIM93352.1 glutamine-hydrolyzing GMP synthase subunit GuaA [Candidatus Poseidoniales archaeon]